MRDRVAAGRLPERGDLLRVAAEGCDVALHPPQGRDLVEQAEIGGAAICAAEIAEDTEPVRHRHDDHALLGNERRGVHDRHVACSRYVGAAVEPHHHRQAVTGYRAAGNGHGEVLAVFIYGEAFDGAAQHTVQKRYEPLGAGRRPVRRCEGPVSIWDGRGLRESRARGVGDARRAGHLPVVPPLDRTARRSEERLSRHR